MEIQYYGGNCVKITTKKASVVVDDNIKELFVPLHTSLCWLMSLQSHDDESLMGMTYGTTKYGCKKRGRENTTRHTRRIVHHTSLGWTGTRGVKWEVWAIILLCNVALEVWKITHD